MSYKRAQNWLSQEVNAWIPVQHWQWMDIQILIHGPTKQSFYCETGSAVGYLYLFSNEGAYYMAHRGVFCANNVCRMSLARGRPFVVPVTRLIKDCDSWYRSAVGDPQDGHLVSMAVLRRDLVCSRSKTYVLCFAYTYCTRMASSPQFALSVMGRRTQSVTDL